MQCPLYNHGEPCVELDTRQSGGHLLQRLSRPEAAGGPCALCRRVVDIQFSLTHITQIFRFQVFLRSISIALRSRRPAEPVEGPPRLSLAGCSETS